MTAVRIAIVGAGPTGFFLAARLLKELGPEDRIDLYEKTPFPYGLVRFGVAPDHPKIKSVTKGFARTLADSRLHFWGGITVAEGSVDGGSTTISVEELLNRYDRVALTVGSQDDRKLGIPSEDAKNSFSATRFVGWYNGHPQDRDLSPDLQVEHATVVGAGNVAIDVVRILISTPERLRGTDISDRALRALSEATVREVDVLVRRGPWDVAFTNPEVKELLDFEDVAFTFDPPLERFQQRPDYADRTADLNMEVFRALESRGSEARAVSCQVHFRFLVSPREVETDSEGQVQGVLLGHNEIEYGPERSSISDGGRTSRRPSGLFIRSVGYLGRPLFKVPYCRNRGVIPCDPEGRVLSDDGSVPVPGLYASGWIRRGPSGVIGTNKKDAHQVAQAMLADPLREPSVTLSEFAVWLEELSERRLVDKDGWDFLDREEIARGESQGRPRRKFLDNIEVQEALATRSETASR